MCSVRVQMWAFSAILPCNSALAFACSCPGSRIGDMLPCKPNLFYTNVILGVMVLFPSVIVQEGNIIVSMLQFYIWPLRFTNPVMYECISPPFLQVIIHNYGTPSMNNPPGCQWCEVKLQLDLKPCELINLKLSAPNLDSLTQAPVELTQAWLNWLEN